MLGAWFDSEFENPVNEAFRCSSLQWYLFSGCWKKSRAEWQAIADASDRARYPRPVVIPPGAPSTPGQLTGEEPWTPEMSLEERWRRQQEADRATIWGAYAGPDPMPEAPLNCGNLWTKVTNTDCWPSAPDLSNVLLVGGLVLGGLVLLQVMRR